MALPRFEDYRNQHLGPGARFQEALTYEDIYLKYICASLDELVNGPVSNGSGGGGGGTGGGGGIVGATLIDPRLTNWHYYTNIFGQLKVAAGGSYQFVKYLKDECGNVLVASIRCSSPSVRLYVRPYSPDGQYLDLQNTADELYALGRVTPPTGIGFDLVKYDNTNNLYSFELRAPWPGLPYNSKVEIYAKNEDSSEITIYDATITLLKLDK